MRNHYKQKLKYFFIRLFNRFWLRSEFMEIDVKLSYEDRIKTNTGETYRYVGNYRVVKIFTKIGFPTAENVFNAMKQMRRVR